ncbi:MAG TPA: hypothetical protein VH593_12260, partial [Ktedonobacteraceae bacterium]
EDVSIKAIYWDFGDGIHILLQEVPEILWAVGISRKTAANTNDRNRFHSVVPHPNIKDANPCRNLAGIAPEYLFEPLTNHE